jgi:ribosomal protein S17
MSKYKPLYSSIWTDNQFENYSPEKKLVYIFLLTNQYVEKSGIYKVSVRQIAFNTSVTNDLINDIINELINEGKIQYDFKEGIIFIKNLFKYQKGMIKNENILLLTLKRNYELVKTEFWNEFFNRYSDDSLASKINDLLIDGSLMAHQLYINNNNNKDKNINKGGMGEEPKTNLELKSKTSNPLTEDFQKFWEDYTPVKVSDGKVVPKGSRKTALIAYERARKKHGAEKIYEGAAKYLVNCYENNRLSCQAVVFLNQERFLDDYQQTNLEVKKHD